MSNAKQVGGQGMTERLYGAIVRFMAVLARVASGEFTESAIGTAEWRTIYGMGAEGKARPRLLLSFGLAGWGKREVSAFKRIAKCPKLMELLGISPDVVRMGCKPMVTWVPTALLESFSACKAGDAERDAIRKQVALALGAAVAKLEEEKAISVRRSAKKRQADGTVVSYVSAPLDVLATVCGRDADANTYRADNRTYRLDTHGCDVTIAPYTAPTLRATKPTAAPVTF